MKKKLARALRTLADGIALGYLVGRVNEHDFATHPLIGPILGHLRTVLIYGTEIEDAPIEGQRPS